MPTNISTPIWRCDLCGNGHADRLDLAEQCESAPLPPVLADGTPLLSANKGHFTLTPLSPTAKTDTLVKPFAGSRPGHHRHYRSSSANWTVSDKDLSPALPGFL